jgi:hypothetical protein
MKNAWVRPNNKLEEHVMKYSKLDQDTIQWTAFYETVMNLVFL